MADQWQKLSPEPDFQQEAVAQARNYEDVQEFGKRFLEIAQGNEI